MLIINSVLEFSDKFVMKLPTAQDDQCIGLHGGVVCRGCKEEPPSLLELVGVFYHPVVAGGCLMPL